MKMFSTGRFVIFTVTLLLFGPGSPMHAGVFQESKTAADDEQTMAEVWNRIDELHQVFDNSSLQRIVKQQFMLTAANAFYIAGETDVPAGLSREVAALTTQQEFEKWLTEKWNESRPDKVGREAADSEVPLVDRISQLIVGQLAAPARFVSAKENRVARQLADNQYVGIGIQVKWENGRAMIVDPFKGGAACKAGAVPNDLILKVDGKSTDDMNLGEVINVLRGGKGTRISVEVQNTDGSEPRTLDMVRDVIPIPSVRGVQQHDDGSWSFMNEEGDQFAYMKIESIVGSTASELGEAARDVIADGCRGVVLDLRSLADGDLHQVNLIADVLCDEMEIGTLSLVSGVTQVLKTRADNEFGDLPVVVLTEQKQVSGPVLALIAALKNRPATTLLGGTVSSGLLCFNSFDLPGGGGAVESLAYARVIPAVAGNDGQIGNATNLLGHATQSGLRYCEPHKKLESAQLISAARNVLKQQNP